ncbi:MAG TPA: ankyrin repeat domain-containing protein [Mucilaginibacter sp.]|nr:ankyrin repeat domain-containing protein [Mucilaginibacter sp.]
MSKRGKKMTSKYVNDPLFSQAITAIDTGDLALLKELIEEHPSLIAERLDSPTGDYFDSPYLIWFLADNPIRNGKLPDNIVEITAMLAAAVKQYAPETAAQQLDYALGLVATGRIPRESGRQIQMMDVLIDAGAKPGSGEGALAHGNAEAAQHLIERGGKLTLSTAVGLERIDEVNRMLPIAAPAERITALTTAAFRRNVTTLTHLLKAGVDPNGYPEKEGGFHSHATPLHQAVASGSLACVKLLLEAGAKTDARDTVYDDTPLGWAMYMQTETDDEGMRNKYKSIEAYLRAVSPDA